VVVKLFANGIFRNGSCLGDEVRINPRGFGCLVRRVSRMIPKFVHGSFVESFVVLVRAVNPCWGWGGKVPAFWVGLCAQSCTKAVSRGIPDVSNSGKNMHVTHACALFRV
jgi:hypothetical protein